MKPGSVAASRMDLLSKILFFGVLFLWIGLQLGLKRILVFSYAPDLGGFERNVIWGIQQIMLGKPLYTNPDAAPFALIQYMPAYYYLVAIIGKILSIDPLNAHSVYSLARCLNALLSLGSVFLLYRMATRNFLISRTIAVFISSLAFLWMEAFTISGRPDCFKGFVFQCLIYVLLQYPSKRKRLVFPLAMMLSVLVFFTKQDGLVFCAILPAVLFLQKEWKQMLVTGLGMALAIAVVFSLFQFGTNGDFVRNVLGGLNNGISISWFVGAFAGYFSVMAVLFGLALVMSLEFVFEKNYALHVLAAGFVFSFFPQLLFSLKYGSGPNYFLECTFVSLLFLGIMVHRLSLKAIFQHSFTHYLLGAAVLVMLFLTSSFHWFTGGFLHQENELKAKYEQQKDVVAWLHKNAAKADFKTLVLINRQWEDHTTTLLADHVVAPCRDVSTQVFNAKKQAGFDPLKSVVESGQVDFIVTDGSVIAPFLKFDYSRYQQMAEIGGYNIFTPRK